MWKWIAGLTVAIFATAGVLDYAAGAINVGVSGGLCRSDDEIEPGLRQSADAAALELANAIVGNDAAKAYAMMTDEVRGRTTASAFSDFVKWASMTGQGGAPKIEHVYIIDTTGSGPDSRAICGEVSGDHWVSAEVKPGLRQAHVVLTSAGRNNDFAMTVWLLPQGDGWRAQFVHFGPSTMVGHSVDDLLALARTERAAGRMFNAAMLYEGASYLADRGPSFQLGVSQPIRSELASLTPPQELQGDPPFTWRLGDRDYKIQQVTILGIEKQIGLVFVLPRTDWPPDAEIEKENRIFLDAYRAAHPDYARVFGFLTAQAMKPDNSGGFRTVYVNGKGY